MKPKARRAILAALNSPAGRRVIITALIALLAAAGLRLEPEIGEALVGVLLLVGQAVAS